MKEEVKVIVFKRQGRILYFIRGNWSAVHFVPTIHFKEYCSFRKNVPVLCKIYNTIQESFKNVANGS
ncbi:hypothetical protein LCGC14_0541810 [marine sediment metagenome]|uniref:Uncharacterized protein n=1 Tax=marine sediment metagenome TaxID=412755 RepID=A0A0F9RXB0_9ZZZZ